MLSAGIVLAMTMAGSASAATVNFGNLTNLNGVAQVAADSSGLTSVNVPKKTEEIFYPFQSGSLGCY